MRIAHIAYSVSDIRAAAEFFCTNFGYGFRDSEPNGLLVLDPPEKPKKEKHHFSVRQFVGPFLPESENMDPGMFAEFHMPPQIVISESQNRTCGIHHVSYEVDNIRDAAIKFQKFGIVEGGCSECSNASSFTVKSRDILGVGIEFFSRNSGWSV